MFFNDTIASTDTAIGVLSLSGQAATKVRRVAIDNFTFRLSAPYEKNLSYYRFKLAISPTIDLSSLNPTTVLNDVMKSFELLLQQSQVILRFGRLTYYASNTRAHVRKQLGIVIFGHEINSEKTTPLAA